MKIISAVSVHEYIPTRPDIPTHYEMELVDVSRQEESPILSVIGLNPATTFERRSIVTLAHRIDDNRKDLKISGYYHIAFYLDDKMSYWYDMSQNVLINQVFKRVKEKKYRLQFTTEETTHIEMMSNAYSVFIDQETKRYNKTKSIYSQKGQDNRNLNLLNSLLSKYRFQ